jgi:hypothetical protein
VLAAQCQGRRLTELFAGRLFKTPWPRRDLPRLFQLLTDSQGVRFAVDHERADATAFEPTSPTAVATFISSGVASRESVDQQHDDGANY